MSEVGDMAERFHDDAAGWDPRGPHGETVGSITEAFSRKLTSLNDRHARMGLPVPSMQDPRDIIGRIDRLAGDLKFSASIAPGTVDAIGAWCIALRLALARLDTLDITSGDAA